MKNTITSGELRVELSEDLKSVAGVYKNEVLFTKRDAYIPVFKIELRNQDATLTEISSSDAKNAVYSNDILTYTELAGADISVDIKLEKGPGSRIGFCPCVKNNSTAAIESVTLMPFVMPEELAETGGSFKILWPFNEGTEIADIGLREKSGFRHKPAKYPSEGAASFFPGIICSQFMAYYDGKNGLYMGTHDSEGNLKEIDVYKKDNSTQFKIKMFTSGDFGKDYCSSYPFVLDIFEGPWQAAAEIYRGWFDENKSADFVKIKDNKNLPEWYHQSPVIIAYPVRGKHDTDVMAPNKLFPYCNALPHADELSEKLDSKLMMLLMHWEGTAPWAPPYVWPPYGGEEPLREFARKLHEKNHVLGVYCSGLGWTQHSGVTFYNKGGEYNSKKLEKVMCTSPEGKVENSSICQGIRYGYDLCPTEDFTVETLTNEVKNMTEGDIDYIQIFDQNHGGISPMCYSREHNHPPVPGKWQTDAMKKLIQKFREASANDKIVFGCESAAAESFVPDMAFNDNRFELAFFAGRAVPLHSYLYHEYINNFMGNQISANGAFSNDLTPQNLFYRIGYSFAAGDMGTVVIDENGKATWNWCDFLSKTKPDHDAVMEYIRKLNFFRQKFPQYLHTGRCVMPLETEGVKEINLEKNYVTPDLLPGDSRDFYVKELLVGCFEAEDKSLGQFMINFTKNTVSGKIITNGRKCTVTDANGKILSGTEICIPPESAVLAVIE